MTQQEFYRRLKNKYGLTWEEAQRLFHMIFDEVIELLIAGESLKIQELGTLDIKLLNERCGFNPNTRKNVMWAAQKVPHFLPSKKLIKRMNGL